MTGKSHAMIGAMSGLTAAWYVVGLERWAVVALAAAVGTVAALLPDLDGTDSTARTTVGLGKEQIKREWRRSKSLGLVMRWLVSIPFNIFAKVIPHRGPTHWLVTWLGLSLLVSAVTPVPIWVAFAAGYLSHLMADALTVAGVPLLGPLTGRSVRFLPRPLAFRTGGLVESLFVSGLIGVYIAAGVLVYLGVV
jgi:inner membrane protein